MSTSTRTCPRCNTILLEDTPEGLCAACVLSICSGGSDASTELTPPPIREVAAAFPELEIIAHLRSGGMGHVFKVRHRATGRTEALKLLCHDDLAVADSDYPRLFEHEARAQAALNHSHIVIIFDSGRSRDGDFSFIRMEFMEGGDLGQRLGDRTLTPQDALAQTPALCDALHAAHEHRDEHGKVCPIIHRDIKPANILLTADGRAKLADFGLARHAHAAGSTILVTGHQAGTPGFAAPEQQVNPRYADARSDIYSLGRVLRHIAEVANQIGTPVPPAVADIARKATEDDPDRRYQTALELKQALENSQTSIEMPASSASRPEIRIGIDYVEFEGERIERTPSEGRVVSLLGKPSREYPNSQSTGEEFGFTDDKALIWDNCGVVAHINAGIVTRFSFWFRYDAAPDKPGEGAPTSTIPNPAETLLLFNEIIGSFRRHAWDLLPFPYLRRFEFGLPNVYVLTAGAGGPIGIINFCPRPLRHEALEAATHAFVLQEGEYPKCFAKFVGGCRGCVTNRRVLIRDGKDRVLSCSLSDLETLEGRYVTESEIDAWGHWSTANPVNTFRTLFGGGHPPLPAHLTMTAADYTSGMVEISIYTTGDHYREDIESFVSVATLYAACARIEVRQGKRDSTHGGVEEISSITVSPPSSPLPERTSPGELPLAETSLSGIPLGLKVRVRSALQPGEVAVFATRLHWFAFVRWVGLAFLALTISVMVGWNPVVLPALCLVPAVIQYFGSEFAVTDRRIIIRQGILSLHSSDRPLHQLANVQVEVSFLERIFGTGSVILVGSGGPSETLKHIVDPAGFRDRANLVIGRSSHAS